MTDPASTPLLAITAIEREVESLPGSRLFPAEAGARLDARLAEQMGRVVPPGVAAFFRRFDGGVLRVRHPFSDRKAEEPPDSEAREPSEDDLGVRLLSFSDSLALIAEHRDSGVSDGMGLRGLWPILERDGRLVALDAEVPTDREWPVVQVADGSVDRLGTSLLRFLHVLCGDLLCASTGADAVASARERCRRDPHLSEHWVDLADALGRRREPGDDVEAERVIHEGARCAEPVGPALLVAIGVSGLLAGDRLRGQTALLDAVDGEPLTARDDDARLDAAALLLVIAADTQNAGLAERARSFLHQGSAATAGFWRGESLRGLALGNEGRAALALRVVETLCPDDRDVARLRAPGAGPAIAALHRARAALEAGEAKRAIEHTRAALAVSPELGLAHATLAEAANMLRTPALVREAVESARAATVCNPALLDGFRELGDALLESGDRPGAIAAFDQALVLDPHSALLHAKRAQALFEDGRRADALEAITNAGEPGADGFFVAAIRGDILAALNRHRDAAEAYEQALRAEPQDHWALHQAALSRAEAGDLPRAAHLFELAVEFDREGCHQTLVDYADVMRKLGRIGDAVRLYRRALLASPGEPGWRQMLKDAEKELSGAPN